MDSDFSCSNFSYYGVVVLQVFVVQAYVASKPVSARSHSTSSLHCAICSRGTEALCRRRLHARLVIVSFVKGLNGSMKNMLCIISKLLTL
mgnify:CR=1 FL=1